METMETAQRMRTIDQMEVVLDQHHLAQELEAMVLLLLLPRLPPLLDLRVMESLQYPLLQHQGPDL
jgi:hypothetical protein